MYRTWLWSNGYGANGNRGGAARDAIEAEYRRRNIVRTCRQLRRSEYSVQVSLNDFIDDKNMRIILARPGFVFVATPPISKSRIESIIPNVGLGI